MNAFIEATKHWFMCDNIVHPMHEGQIGLLHMVEPQCFILIRDYGSICFAEDLSAFVDHIAEINFFHPEDRNTADINKLTIDAWNFLAIQEQYEEQFVAEHQDMFEDEMFDENGLTEEDYENLKSN